MQEIPDAPNASSAAAGEFEARLTELEIKASFAEDTIDRLNEVIVRQQGAGTEAAGFTSLRDELPPHY